MGQRGGVGAALAACGVDVALDGVVRLVARLVKRAQVHPGGGVAVVQLHGADVGLQSIHGLVLLLVQYPEEGYTRQNEGEISKDSLIKPQETAWFEFTFPILGNGKALLPDRAPGVSTGLGFIYGLPIGDESVLDLPNTRVAPEGDTGGQSCATDARTDIGLPKWGMCASVAPAKEVPGLSGVGVGLQRLLQTLDGIAVPAGSVPELFHGVMHPPWG